MGADRSLRRDERSLLPSLTRLMPFLRGNPALKRWAIFDSWDKPTPPACAVNDQATGFCRRSLTQANLVNPVLKRRLCPGEVHG